MPILLRSWHSQFKLAGLLLNLLTLSLSVSDSC